MDSFWPLNDQPVASNLQGLPSKHIKRVSLIAHQRNAIEWRFAGGQLVTCGCMIRGTFIYFQSGFIVFTLFSTSSDH